ncbi:MAG: phosphotransferase [Candidatus Thorarchaeota archaeon]
MLHSTLESYLKSAYPQRANLTVQKLAELTDGWGTEIHSFNLDYSLDGKNLSNQLVLRMYPSPYGEYRSEKEYLLLRGLNEAGYPVPVVQHLETDGSHLGMPFIIMDRIEGHLLDDDLQITERQDESLNLFCKLFVNLHLVDWKGIVQDPSGFESNDPHFFVNDGIASYKETLEHHNRTELFPILEWLQDRANNVPCDSPSLIHGDFHPRNILIDNDGTPFVIDWTASAVTDYRADLAWTLLLASTYWGKKYREIIMQKYEAIAGRKIEEIEFFEVFAILRRMFDISVSLSSSATDLGMREDAADMMRESLHHVRNVYALLQDYTGIKVSEFEQLIQNISK